MIQTLALPHTIFPYVDYIRRLNLSFLGPDVTDEMLICFSPCTRLERLLLPGSVHATESALERVLANCSSGLLSLDLSEIPCVTDSLVEHIARGCPGLHTLYLGSCPALTDEAIVKVAKGCPLLKRIKLTQCTLLTDRSILALTQCCPQLIEMDLSSCSLLTNSAVQAVFETLPQVRDVNLTLVTNLNHLAFSSIHPLTNRFEQLRILNFTSCIHLTDDILTQIIPAAPRLRSLALTKCDKITDLGAGVIKILGKHLHYLHLGHCAKITDRLMISLAQHCMRIRYLDLACCSKLTDATLFALAQLPKLRRIGLVKCSNITDHGLYALLVTQVLPQTLERVHLSYCVNLSDVAVAALVNQCSKLTHLSLTGVPAFMSPRYQTFCRPPPPEFTAYQRYVFCVFSGRGVRELRQSMQDHPSTVAGIPIPITSIRAVAASLMVAEQDNNHHNSGIDIGADMEDDDDSNQSSYVPALDNSLVQSPNMEDMEDVHETAIGTLSSTSPPYNDDTHMGQFQEQEDSGTEDMMADQGQSGHPFRHSPYLFQPQGGQLHRQPHLHPFRDHDCSALGLGRGSSSVHEGNESRDGSDSEMGQEDERDPRVSSPGALTPIMDKSCQGVGGGRRDSTRVLPDGAEDDEDGSES
ncbi:SCF ubiquitin ligase complex subunit [Podila minutissima]|uniref:SCF ubiquitin ligase complex subunit n=1 Tax=Podila minutissima TaxID=64525 RepID=A0A9P5VKH0_9FUNG|nr:SCF ubiquitin ligase complex subunit [Podila minutissima]